MVGKVISKGRQRTVMVQRHQKYLPVVENGGGGLRAES